MTKMGITAFGFMVSLAVLGHAFAAEFSADMINKAAGQTMQSKIYMKDNKIRMETKGEKAYSIVRMDKKLMWVIMPEEKSYMEMISDQLQQVPGEKMKDEVGRKYLGSETVNGYPTKKYEVTIKNGEISDKAYQWIATDLNYPIKIAAVDGNWSTEYKNIKTGGQSDSLFEIPAGYEKMAMPAMPGMGPGPGVPPGAKRGK
jgi:hypothetical protein